MYKNKQQILSLIYLHFIHQNHTKCEIRARRNVENEKKLIELLNGNRNQALVS